MKYHFPPLEERSLTRWRERDGEREKTKVNGKCIHCRLIKFLYETVCWVNSRLFLLPSEFSFVMWTSTRRHFQSQIISLLLLSIAMVDATASYHSQQQQQNQRLKIHFSIFDSILVNGIGNAQIIRLPIGLYCVLCIRIPLTRKKWKNEMEKFYCQPITSYGKHTKSGA